MFEKAHEVLTKLIELTRKDKIHWDAMLEMHTSCYRGNEMHAEFPRDEPPYFVLNGKRVQSYGIGIEVLLHEIREQYKRQNRNGYGYDTDRARVEADRSAREAARNNVEDFNAEARRFLDGEKKKQRR